MADLTFVSVNRGGRVTLDDDAIWRIAPDYLPIVITWQEGDPIALIKNTHGNRLYQFRLVNEATGEDGPCVSSPRMDHWHNPFGPIFSKDV